MCNAVFLGGFEHCLIHICVIHLCLTGSFTCMDVGPIQFTAHFCSYSDDKDLQIVDDSHVYRTGMLDNRL